MELELPNGMRVECEHYAARTEMAVLLAESGPRAHEFARIVSAFGVAQALVPYEPIPESTIARLSAVRPELPLIVRRLSADGTADLYFLGRHFGKNGGLPSLEFFRARDGVLLAYRHYPAGSSRVVILLHGATAHSGVYGVLAHFLSAHGTAQVYTPNLRGHFRSGPRAGDVDYVGQLEDDLADLIQEIRTRTPEAQIILAGHSLGAGLLIRFAGGRNDSMVDAYVLLAPYLGHFAPTTRIRDGRSWARVKHARLIGLVLANVLRLRHWNALPLVEFHPPETVRDGAETLDYSYRLLLSMSPRLNYRRDLARIAQPILVVVGEQDEMFRCAAFAREIARTRRGRLALVPNATHLGIVYSPRAHGIIRDWLERQA